MLYATLLIDAYMAGTVVMAHNGTITRQDSGFLAFSYFWLYGFVVLLGYMVDLYKLANGSKPDDILNDALFFSLSSLFMHILVWLSARYPAGRVQRGATHKQPRATTVTAP